MKFQQKEKITKVKFLTFTFINKNISLESGPIAKEKSIKLVDLLIKKASNLTARDRNNLLKFLSNIDDDGDNNRNVNQFLKAEKN